MNKMDLESISTPIEMVEKSGHNYDDGLPLDMCKLPSKGLIYPEDHPLHMKSAVEFKAMTTHEENILATPALIKQGTVLNVLLGSCLTDKSIDTETLLMGDKAALLISIRVSGFGEEYGATTFCQSCKKSAHHTFNLGNAELKPLGAEPLSPGVNLFDFKLPKSKKAVKFSLPTDGDDLEIAKMQENKKKALTKSAGLRVGGLIDTSNSDRINRAIKEIDGDADPVKIKRFIERMTALDSRKLRAYMAKIEPDMTMKEEVSCVHCGETSLRFIPMGYEFFWPKDIE